MREILELHCRLKDENLEDPPVTEATSDCWERCQTLAVVWCVCTFQLEHRGRALEHEKARGLYANHGVSCAFSVGKLFMFGVHGWV